MAGGCIAVIFLISGLSDRVDPSLVAGANGRDTPEALEALRLHSPLIKIRYEWRQGFVGVNPVSDGFAPPRMMTIAAALSACDAEVRCRSVTHEGANDTSGEVTAYLNSISGRVTARLKLGLRRLVYLEEGSRR